MQQYRLQFENLVILLPRRGVENGIRWLKEELDYLQSFISDAETKQEIDQRIAKWINNVRDVANDAVIILDRINVLHEEHAAPKHGVLDSLHSFIGLCKKEAKLYHIGREIKSLKGRIVEIKKRREEYGITIILASSKVLKRKRTLLRATSFENQVDVVGFEDDVKTLLAKLVGGDPSLSVISIHGMGGLGKTTLASKLYHSSELSHFESRAWVCVSQEYNIVVLSGLLLHKKSYEAWSKVKDHIWGHLTDNSLEIQEILSLSYADLSFQMRQCFLYLARFPEDQTFEVYNLKLLWIAEEFISQADEKDGVCMEDVADKYLNELINRNMIQIATLLWNGQVLECRVHDLVRDLAIQKATEHKLLGIFDSSKQHPSSIRLLQQPRHAVYNGIGKYFEMLGPSSYDLKLRSLAVINEPGRYVRIKEIKMMYIRFKYLKVLDFSSVNSDGIPAEIGDLVLLKYLGLMGTHIISNPLAIPPTIGKLKKLQTLYTLNSTANLKSLQTFILEFRTNVTIKYTSQLNFLPDSVTHLTLVNSEFPQDAMPILGSLSNLTTLYLIRVYKGKKMVCIPDSFRCLQFFRLQYLSNLEDLQVKKNALPSLRGLDIDGCVKLKIKSQRIQNIAPIPDVYKFRNLHYGQT